MQLEQEQVAAASENDQRRKDLSQGGCVNALTSNHLKEIKLTEESSRVIDLADEDAPSEEEIEASLVVRLEQLATSGE
jgi:hypothetical protein